VAGRGGGRVAEFFCSSANPPPLNNAQEDLFWRRINLWLHVVSSFVCTYLYLLPGGEFQLKPQTPQD